MATAQARQDEVPNVALIEAGIAADAAKAKDRAAKEAEFQAVIQKDLVAMGLDTKNPETLINLALVTSPLGASEKAAADIAKGVMPKVIEGMKHIPEGLQKIKAALPQTVQDALPMSARDLAHLMFTPQNASPVRMDKFKELVNSGEVSRAVKMQHASLPYASATIVGTTTTAANLVLDHYKNQSEQAIAELPLNEQKALAYEAGHINLEKRKVSLEKYPDLKEAFAAYDVANAEALKKFPESKAAHNASFEGQYGGQSEASSKQATYTYQASQAIYKAIKNGDPIPQQPEHHSNASKALNETLASLDPEQRKVVVETIAANIAGKQQDQEMSRS